MAQEPGSFRIVLTTTDSAESAERIARAVVERGVAACVNVIGPIRSVYRWKGEITNDEERLLLIKTTAARLPELRRTVKELHGYEIPEILSIAIEDGDPAYLEWIAACVGGRGDS